MNRAIYPDHQASPVGIFSRFSCNSEASASDFQKNLEEIFLGLGSD